MVDSERRGLLVPAWTGGQNYHGAKVVFVAESPFAGKTVPEVAREIRARVETVRDCALAGKCPTTLAPRRRKGCFWT